MTRSLACLLLCGLGLMLAICAVAKPIDDPALRERLKVLPTAKTYPGMDAACLYREMEVTVDPSGAYTVRDRKMMTILTPEGLSLAQWSILYDKATERVAITRACTWVAGQVYDADLTKASESAVYPGMNWYSALTLQRIPLPAAMVGATLDVETVHAHTQPRVPGAFGARLSLQQAYPVREARYVFRTPAAMPLSIRLLGVNATVAETREGNQRVYRWTLTDVSALRPTEASIPPVEELAASARITSLSGWAPVTAWYAKLTDGKADDTDRLRQTARERTAGCATLDETLDALHKAVRELPYVAIEMGQLSDMPHPAQATAEQQYGDCKDKATLLKALLAAVGIQSDYVLVRTTDHGALDRALYSPSEFNHVILAVRAPGGDRFLDATIADAPTDQLPPGTAGADALIVRGDGVLVRLPDMPATRNLTRVRVAVTVAPDRSARGTVTMTFTGQTAVFQRGMLANVPVERQQEALEGGLAARLGGEAVIGTVTVTHLREPEQPLEIAATFTVPAYLQEAGEGYSGVLPTFMYQLNRYRSVTTRALAFHQPLGSRLQLEAEITLPETYAVTRLPAAVQYDCPAGSYRDSAAVDGRILRFTCDYTLNPGDYPAATLPDIKKLAALLALEGRNGLQFFVKAVGK